jgi:arabinofuranosyltransferase
VVGKRISWLVTVALVGVFLVELILFFGFTADDAFIVARYAENLVRLGELVFNAGERISALTSPMHAFINAFLFVAFGDTIVANKLAAIAVVVASLVVAARSLPSRFRVLFLALMCSPFVALWAVGGMETPYLLAVTTLLVVMLRQDSGRLGLLSVLVGCSILLRYDAVVFALPLVIHLILQNRRRLLSLIPGLLLVTGWLVFSALYFHDIFPTSYYSKMWSAQQRFGQFYPIAGAVYETQFFFLTGIWLFLPGFLHRGWFSSGRFRETRSYLRRRWWLWSGLLLVCGYGLIASTVHMMFSYRLLIPYLPVAAIFVIDVLDTLAPAVKRGHLLARFPAWAAAGVACFQLLLTGYMYLVSVNPSYIGEYRSLSARSYLEFVDVMRDASADVRRHWSGERPPRIFTFAGGVLPYYYPDAYIYESLVSYRENCSCDRKLASDYVHLITPRHGPVGDQLPSQGDYELVSDYQILFDGREEHFQVYHNSLPVPCVLPSYVDGECLE